LVTIVVISLFVIVESFFVSFVVVVFTVFLVVKAVLRNYIKN